MKAYQDWLDCQMVIIGNAISARARYGAGANNLFFVPATATEFGRIAIGQDAPEGATDVIRLPTGCGLSSDLNWIPTSYVRQGLYDACRRLPIFPTHPIN